MFVKADRGSTSCKNDKCMTPKKVAEALVGLLDISPKDSCVDPFLGEGAFYDSFKNKCRLSEWAEIDKGIDFFDVNKHYDWCISNPPYSIFDAVLDHSFEIADNVCYLVPLSKVFSSMGRIRKWLAFGNIKQIAILSAGKCGFPFGFPCAFVWWQKDYRGQTKIFEK